MNSATGAIHKAPSLRHPQMGVHIESVLRKEQHTLRCSKPAYVTHAHHCVGHRRDDPACLQADVRPSARRPVDLLVIRVETAKSKGHGPGHGTALAIAAAALVKTAKDTHALKRSSDTTGRDMVQYDKRVWCRTYYGVVSNKDRTNATIRQKSRFGIGDVWLLTPYN